MLKLRLIRADVCCVETFYQRELFWFVINCICNFLKSVNMGTMIENRGLLNQRDVWSISTDHTGIFIGFLSSESSVLYWSPSSLVLNFITRCRAVQFAWEQGFTQSLCSVAAVHSAYWRDLSFCFPLKTGRNMFQVSQPIIMMMTVIIERCSVAGE